MSVIRGKIQANNGVISGSVHGANMFGATGSGVDYYKGDKGDKGEDGRDGRDGIDGVNGRDGVDGYTPIKGVDYFTQGDIDEIISQIDIPPSYEMATSTDMSDWSSGKVVDAAALKTDFNNALYLLNTKADTRSLANVAFSGAYTDLVDQPTILTTSDVNALIDAKLGVIENGTY